MKSEIEVKYKGIELKLYSFKHLQKALGKAKNTILKYERYGHLPKAMFKMGGYRYYSFFEIQALYQAKVEFGIPGEVYDDKQYKFFSAVKESWTAIRKDLSEGKEPDLPILVQFKNKLELRGWIQDVLRKANVISPIYVEQVVKRLLDMRKI